MSKLELLAKKDGDQDSPVDLVTNILVNYSAKHEFDTSVLDSIFSNDNTDYVDTTNRKLVEFIRDNKSDYVILEDYSESEFTITDVVKTYKNFYWEDMSFKVKPVWRWNMQDDRGSITDGPTDEDIIRLQQSNPDLYNQLPVRYESVSYFNIKETKKSKLPEECLIEVGITYKLSELSDAEEYHTHEIVYLDRRNDSQSHSSKFIDGDTGMMEVKTLHGLDIRLPIQWENGVTHEINEFYWKNEDNEVKPIIYSYFGKSTESRSFLIVYNERTIYIYLLNDSIKRYWIDYCKIYPLNSRTNGEN